MDSADVASKSGKILADPRSSKEARSVAASVLSQIQSMPLVLIEWEDSRQPIAEWQYLSDFQDCGALRCRSVGWLIYDGDDVKALAPNAAELDTLDAQISGIIRIPSRCIVAIHKLKKKSWPQRLKRRDEIAK